MTTKTIDTLVEDVFQLFDPKVSHNVDEDNLTQFGETVKDIVRKRLLERDQSKDNLRFSALGRPDRQIWLQAQEDAPTEEMRAQTYYKFLYGDLIEAMMVFLVKESGHDVQMEQHEIEVDGVKGHIDCTIDGVVVDVKSAAPYSYQKFVKQTFYEDIFSKQYLDQLCGYANVLTPDKAPAFLVFDKVSGDICVRHVSASIMKDFQPAPRIAHLKEVLASDQIPPKCYPDEEEGKSGNRKLGLGCSYCGQKKKCWPGVRKFIYSNGPKYLTTVKKTPDVYEDTSF